MAIRIRSLAIKLTSSSAAAAHNFTRSTISTYSCYNNVIKASPKPRINSSFITKFLWYDQAQKYSCYNVIRESLESEINTLVMKGSEKSSIIDDQDLKKAIATYTSNAWISMENLLNKYQIKVLLNDEVGLSGTTRSLQKDLNTICKKADTSGEEGYRYILQETAAALIRNPDDCITCCSSVDVNRGIEKSERVYRRRVMKERSKFDELTNNIKKKKATSGRSNGFGSENIVVTIIVCATGIHSLPPIKNREDYNKALEMLASIPDKFKGVEVLWTPQMKDDILTKEEMRKKYPELQPFDETVEKWSTSAL